MAFALTCLHPPCPPVEPLCLHACRARLCCPCGACIGLRVHPDYTARAWWCTQDLDADTLRAASFHSMRKHSRGTGSMSLRSDEMSLWGKRDQVRTIDWVHLNQDSMQFLGQVPSLAPA